MGAEGREPDHRWPQEHGLNPGRCVSSTRRVPRPGGAGPGLGTENTKSRLSTSLRLLLGPVPPTEPPQKVERVTLPSTTSGLTQTKIRICGSGT